MILTRRAIASGGAVIVAAAILPRVAVAESSAGLAPDAIVIARAGVTVLSARETHLVLTPVPPPRRPPPKVQPKSKGPAVRRMHLVLRDVVARTGTPVHDVYLLLEGPNVFEATVTKLHVGELKLVAEGGEQRETVAFDVNDVIAQLAKIRGYNIRHLRVAIVRRTAGEAASAKAAPSDPKPPEIAAVELVRS